jgi:hypothetical protein
VPIQSEPATPAPTPIQRKRPSRYWRDSLKQTTGEEVEETSASSQRFIGAAGSRTRTGDEPESDSGDGGDGGAWWQSLMASDDGGPNRSLIVMAIVALVVLALLIFGITRLIGNDDEDPETANTPVPTLTPNDQVIVASTPQPTPAGQDEGPAPTETPEVRRGGDNQLSPPGNDEGTPSGARPDFESEVARACTQECLIRLVGQETTRVLEETGNRPSFVGGDVAWAVVSPDEAEALDRGYEIALVADGGQTYNLYVITSPDGAVDPALAAQYGEVIDNIGAHSLVAFNTVPAYINPLVEDGYQVHKLAPAPVLEEAVGDRPALARIDGGDLMGAVDTDNLRQTITDLTTIGELDNSGLGTRYYAYPGNQIAADYIFQELESYGLDVWYEDFISWDGLLLVNVVAETPGKDDGETYAVMSHFDTFSTTNPRQAPGADDNATGIAVNLEVARILAQYEPGSSIRFAFVNAEEVGIQGASAWARNANAQGVNVRGVLNVDSVGSARQGGYVVTNTDNGSAWLQEAMSEVNDEYGLGQTIQHLQNPEIVADDNMVRDEGIDAVMIARELYGWTPFHHTVDDTMKNVSIDSVTVMTYLTLMTTVQLAG